MFHKDKKEKYVILYLCKVFQQIQFINQAKRSYSDVKSVPSHNNQNIVDTWLTYMIKELISLSIIFQSRSNICKNKTAAQSAAILGHRHSYYLPYTNSLYVQHHTEQQKVPFQSLWCDSALPIYKRMLPLHGMQSHSYPCVLAKQ